MSWLTPEEERRLRQHWGSEQYYARQTARVSENSFIRWMRETGLDWLAGKVFDIGIRVVASWLGIDFLLDW